MPNLSNLALLIPNLIKLKNPTIYQQANCFPTGRAKKKDFELWVLPKNESLIQIQELVREPVGRVNKLATQTRNERVKEEVEGGGGVWVILISRSVALAFFLEDQKQSFSFLFSFLFLSLSSGNLNTKSGAPV